MVRQIKLERLSPAVTRNAKCCLHCGGWNKLARVKHSSLILAAVNDEKKNMICDIDTWRAFFTTGACEAVSWKDLKRFYHIEYRLRMDQRT